MTQSSYTKTPMPVPLGFRDAAPPPLASRRHTLHFVVIVGGIAGVGLLQARRSAPSHPVSHVPLYLSLAALQLLFVWFVRKGIRAHGYSLLGLLGRCWRSSSEAATDIVLAVTFVVLLRGLTALLHHVLGPSLANARFLLPSGTIESLLWAAVAIIAGSCEELIYRGYLQRQLWSLTQSLSVAILLQAIIFATAHLYQGWRPAMLTGVFGLAFGLLAAWRKSIVPGAIAHSLIDIVGGLVPR